MDSEYQHFSQYENLGNDDENIDLNSQYVNSSQFHLQTSISESNPFGQSNLSSHPNFSMNASYPSHAHPHFATRFLFQDLLHSPTFPFDSPTAKTSRASKKNSKISQNTNVSQTSTYNKNWTKVEDVALTKAWLYVSVDSDIGNNQKNAAMWNRILQTWRDNMGTYDESRTINSLACRWGKILAAVNKFHAIYERLERNPQSGTTPEDMKREAMRMYEDVTNDKAFKYEHCWEIMRKNPKWCTKGLTKTKVFNKQKVISASDSPGMVPSTPMNFSNQGSDFINLDSTLETGDVNANEIERPQGRKNTKDKKKRLNDDKGVVDALNKLQSTLERQISVSQEELKLKREKDQKDFELREQIMKKEMELKENAQKLKEKDQQLKENAQKLKEKAQKRQEQERILNQDVSKLPPAL